MSDALQSLSRFLPELILMAALAVVIVADLLTQRRPLKSSTDLLTGITLVGLLGALVTSWQALGAGEAQSLFASMLADDGLALIYVPSIPLAPFLRVAPFLRRYMTGYLYSDHINAFTPSTLRFFCERAGFQTLEVSPFLPGAAGLINHVPLLNRIVDGCVYVGKKIPDWEYPGRATRRATETGPGFVYRWDDSETADG